MSIIVYGGSISPFVRKVRVVLAEKGIELRFDMAAQRIADIDPFARDRQLHR